jgi:EAL domain-containing protein (putative c-di-GMP-specific phosphodiesterase class I)
MERMTNYFPLDSSCSQKIHTNRLLIEEKHFFDLLDYIEAHLNTEEIWAAKTQEPDKELDISHLQPVLSYKGEKETVWIDQLIRERRITTHFQPIVEFKNNRMEIYGYECLSRGLDEEGRIIPPFKLFEAARARQKLFALDRLCRLESIKNGAIIKNKKLFINFIPTAIYVPEHCLASTFKLIKLLNLDPGQIVFEVVETDKIENTNHLKNILDYYKKHGFSYALDDVGTGYNQLDALPDLRPDYIKLAIEYTNGVSKDSEKQQAAIKMLNIASEKGSRALAEGVETREDLEWLTDIGYDLFQGYYFSKPSADPVKVLDHEGC